MTKPLGDTHNFGKFLHREGDWVIKPRPIFWEELFLNNESPLRKFTKQFFSSDPFQWYPSLNFQYSDGADLPFSGKVEFFESTSLKLADHHQVSKALGVCLANCLFWGITDLHRGNLAFGTDKEGSVVVFPLDIEAVFFDFKLLSHSYFLKSVKNKKHVTGINRFIDNQLDINLLLENFIYFCRQYSNKSNEIIQFLKLQKVSAVPIRCILKNTSFYQGQLEKESTIDEVFEEEQEQLDRGDIPYFYTYIDNNDIFYLSDNGEKKINHTWIKAFGEQKYSAITTDNLVRNISEPQLIVCVLQILRNLDPGVDIILESEFCTIEFKDSEVFYCDDKIGKIKCQRLPK